MMNFQHLAICIKKSKCWFIQNTEIYPEIIKPPKKTILIYTVNVVKTLYGNQMALTTLNCRINCMRELTDIGSKVHCNE